MTTVSIVSPTYKRHRFIPFLIEQFQKQDYEKNNMELVILDDSPNRYPFKIEDKRVRYVYKENKETIASKRNELNNLAKNEIIVCMDDDDIYPKDRVSHAVDTLLKDSTIKIVGCSSLHIYNTRLHNLFFFKARQQKVILNNTFAYRRSIIAKQKYKKTKLNCFEEKTFTDNFTIPYKLLDNEKTIVCVSHNKNTVDKEPFCSKKGLCIDMPDIDIPRVYNLHPKLYWINLRRSADRKKSMTKQFIEYRFRDEERIEGVDESDIDYDTKVYSKAQIGCLLSHMKAMEKSLEDKYRDTAVICEDDIDLKNLYNFHDIIFYYTNSAPKNWEVLQLYVINHKRKVNNKRGLNKYLEWEKWRLKNFSTMIYIIKKDYAKQLIKIKDKIDSRTRHLLADDFIYNKGKTYSVCVPYYTEKTDFTSLIDTSHSGMHLENVETISKSCEIVYPFE